LGLLGTEIQNNIDLEVQFAARRSLKSKPIVLR